MPFNPKLLPPTVYDVYKKGPGLWVLTVKTAIEVGIKDINKLTDIAFHLHNPDLKGRSLKVGETKLIEQWNYFKKLIRSMVATFPVFRPSIFSFSMSIVGNVGTDGREIDDYKFTGKLDTMAE